MILKEKQHFGSNNFFFIVASLTFSKKLFQFNVFKMFSSKGLDIHRQVKINDKNETPKRAVHFCSLF